jgi:hypothetical protein
MGRRMGIEYEHPATLMLAVGKYITLIASTLELESRHSSPLIEL